MEDSFISEQIAHCSIVGLKRNFSQGAPCIPIMLIRTVQAIAYAVLFVILFTVQTSVARVFYPEQAKVALQKKAIVCIRVASFCKKEATEATRTLFRSAVKCFLFGTVAVISNCPKITAGVVALSAVALASAKI